MTHFDLFLHNVMLYQPRPPEPLTPTIIVANARMDLIARCVGDGSKQIGDIITGTGLTIKVLQPLLRKLRLADRLKPRYTGDGRVYWERPR